MCLCVGGPKTESFCAYTHSVVEHTLFLGASALCSPECHWCVTHHVSLLAADNEHINMYISSWVNACLALQFHGLVSG